MFSIERKFDPTSFLRRSVLKTSLILLVCALLIGGFLRLYHLDQNPQGIHPDEALYGYEGWSIMTTGCDTRHTGCPPIYLKGYSTDWDNRTSILYPYMFALLWRVFPMTLFFLRFPSVVFGTALIALTYVFGRQLFPDKKNIAGIASLIVAISPTAIAWSRLAHDPISMPLFCLAIALTILGTPRRPWLWIVAASLLALGMYGYQPFKAVGPLVFLLSFWYIKPRLQRLPWRWIVPAILIGLLLAGPFLYNQIVNWSIVQRDYNLLSIFQPDSATTWYSFMAWNAWQLLWQAISNPAISLIVVPIFAVLGFFFRTKKNSRAVWFLALWCMVAILPALITMWEPGKNEVQSRTLGLVGPLELLASLGLVWFWQTVIHVQPHRQRRMSAAVLIVALIGSVVFSGWVNHQPNRGGWCCFVLGGMEKVISTVQEPRYESRPVVIDRFNFMQSMNLLWNAKIPPVDLLQPSTRWSTWISDTTHTQLVTHVDRYTLCEVETCYQPNDNALYVVPSDKLTNLPTVATFTLYAWLHTYHWKIVDNASPPSLAP